MERLTCDEPAEPGRTWTLPEFDKLVRSAIDATGLYADEARSALLKKLHYEITVRRDLYDVRRLTEQDAWEILRVILTLWPFAGGLHGLDDRERRQLVREIQQRITARTVTAPASSPQEIVTEPGPGEGWRQHCAACGRAYIAKAVHSRACSDTCKKRLQRSRKQAAKSRADALASSGSV